MGEKKYAIGIGMNLFDARALLMREDGKVITRLEKKRSAISANESITTLLSLFEDILDKSQKYRKNIIGAGLALGGVVDKKKGVVYWPQKQDSSYVYISVPFKKYLEDKFNLPIFMENDSNACAWAEYTRNYPSNKSLIYMFSGVGCGLIFNGELYQGKDGGAGELFVSPHQAMTSMLGDFHFLSQWPVDLGMIKRAKEIVSLGKTTSLLKKVKSTGELSLEDVLSEVKNKDKAAREIVKEAALPLGVKISFLINLLNPEVIILGGGFEEAGEFFLEEVLKVVRQFSFSALRKNLKIHLSTLGREAPPLGSANLIFKEKSLL